MRKSLLTFILLAFIFLSGSLMVTASSITFDKQFEFANDEEPQPWDNW